MSSESCQAHVLTEEEATRGWLFTVELRCGDESRQLRVRLDWADYEHWSHGRTPPSDVIRGALACAASIIGASKIPDRCDAAMLRRLAPGMDESIGQFLPR